MLVVRSRGRRSQWQFRGWSCEQRLAAEPQAALPAAWHGWPQQPLAEAADVAVLLQPEVLPAAQQLRQLAGGGKSNPAAAKMAAHRIGTKA
jgi:hypothetical protein